MNEINATTELSDEERLKIILDLGTIKKHLKSYTENTQGLMLALQIEMFLNSYQKGILEKVANLKSFYEKVKRKLKKLDILIRLGIDEELIEQILSLLGEESTRNSEYRIIQFQIVFILLSYSKVKIKNIRIMNKEQLNSLINSIHDIDPKGREKLLERMHMIDFFFKKYDYLGCYLVNNNSAKIMAYSTFSTMINDELKRVSIQLNRYQEGMV